MTADHSTEIDAFNEAIAGWDDKIPCDWHIEAAGRFCKRAAVWHLDMHGCVSGLVCTQHLNAWRRFNANRGPECAFCDGLFHSLEDAHTARKL